MFIIRSQLRWHKPLSHRSVTVHDNALVRHTSIFAMRCVVLFHAFWISSGLFLQGSQRPGDWVGRCAQRCSMKVDRACSENYSGAWDMSVCGGWAPENLQNGIPSDYASMLRVAKGSLDKLGQAFRTRASGDMLCYGAVNSEETFELARKVGQLCDEYVFFSNFSNPDLHVIKIMDGSMHAPQGGNFISSLNTPVFLPIFRYVATQFAKRYKWFVKYDMDTVFQPDKLRAALAQHDHAVPGIVFPTGMGPGAIHIASQSAMAQYAVQHTSCEDELGEFLPAEDVYFNPMIWHENGVWPNACNWSNAAFTLPEEFQGRNLEPCELDAIAQRASQVTHVEAMQMETSQEACNFSIDDVRSRLFVHNVKSRDAYDALLNI
ncbi:unnamed protein product [Prorocentrum cordatum]|uniref:Hexosyltransferase n=1 Tax=Prorocentrum cordatum TaxID=2364126 RepID=A0ABN9U6P6_9DINO|nr:unnamed protein product [Polarella glacialis]